MAGNIWILAEEWKGQIAESTYELLALGREVADAMGVSLEAVVLGDQAKALAASLGAADNVIAVEHPALAHAIPEAYGEVLKQLAAQKSPHSILVPLTNASWDIIGLLPAQLNMPFVNFCGELKVVDGKLQAKCLLYGGKMEVTVAPESPAILSIMPGTRPPDQGRSDKTPVVEVAAIAPPEPAVKFKNYIEPEAGQLDITQQDVLVSVGRGIQTQDNLELAEELAGLLGGAVSGSRPVIDQGWLPLSRQVGKSGMKVKPKLYLALGISGAPEHQEGMKSADCIIAVNMDPEAPIFGVAHYGVVGDLFDVVPSLIEKTKTMKG
jgi:electron transfer flavoprotein alpha subunit